MKTDFKKEKIPFTQVANEVLNDPNLSAKAKGLYAYLYSKPEGWDFALDRIAKDFSDGRKSIYTGIKELEDNHYLTREKLSTGRTLYVLKSQLPEKGNRREKPVAHFGKEPKRQRAKKGSISNKDIKVIKSISNKENVRSKKSKFKYTDQDLFLAETLLTKIIYNYPDFENKKVKIDEWAEDIRKLREIDKATPQQINFMINWIQGGELKVDGKPTRVLEPHEFWSKNIMSASKLRKQWFDNLVPQLQNSLKGKMKKEAVAQM